MPWPPDPQPACTEPCCTDTDPCMSTTTKCTPDDRCDYCVVPEVTRRWLDRVNPAPVEPPPEPTPVESLAKFMASDLVREAQETTQNAREKVAGHLGIPVERVQPSLFPQPNGPALPSFRILSEPKRVSIIRRILNATRRTT